MAARSPNYPSTSLGEAVEKLKLFFTEAQRNTVDAETAARAIGHKGLNGVTRMKLSAMKKYGLLVEGANGTVKITPLGLRIVHPSPDGLEDALREAAFTPEIFRSVYSTHANASTNVLTSYLIREKGFTPDGAQVFDKVFRETMSLAKPNSPTYVATRTPDPAPELNMMETPVSGSTPTAPAAAKMPMAGTAQGTLFLTVPYRGADLSVRVELKGQRLTRDHVAKVRKYLELAEEDLDVPQKGDFFKFGSRADGEEETGD